MKTNLTSSVKIFISADPEKQHGSLSRGTAALLRGVQEYGSLNKAAQSMGMAYSKAWGLINKLEDNFQFKFIVRAGANGSHLTDEGAKLLDSYYAIEKEAEELVRMRVSEITL
ncbi:MAG: winged helix-turn-helix domain-containing protein [Raoultibacter sp.]|jgi:molybdate transport system regulatory protein